MLCHFVVLVIGLVHDSFNARIGDKPHQRDSDVETASQPWLDKGYGDADGVEHGRKLPFPVAAERRGELGVTALAGKDETLQKLVSSRGEKQHSSVKCTRQGCEMVLTHPACDE